MERFKAMFRGRNGFDALNAAIVVLAALLSVTRFTRGFAIGLLALAIFRILSRNTYMRQMENTKFVMFAKNLWQRIRGRFRGRPNTVKHKPNKSWADKNYKIVNCPKCKQKLRLPRGKGKLKVHCKTCGHTFEIKT